MGKIFLPLLKMQRNDVVRSKLAALDLSEQDIADAVAWARKGWISCYKMCKLRC